MWESRVCFKRLEKEEKTWGWGKNAFRAVSRPKHMGYLRNNWYLLVHQKIVICDGLIGQWVNFQVPLESLDSELFGQCYGQFTKTGQINWSYAQFCLNSIFEAVLCGCCILQMKVLWDFLSFPYWHFKSQFKFGGKRYEFSKMDLKMVIKYHKTVN